MENEINSFRGEYSWLSNFHPCQIEYEGILYQSAECAYIAAKTHDVLIKIKISKMTSADAKKFGKTMKLRDDWEKVKLKEMAKILKLKFNIPELRNKLISTGNSYIEEGNWWGDTYWGICNGTGKNYLGKLIMAIRKKLNETT